MRIPARGPILGLSTALTVGSTVAVFKGQKQRLGLGTLAQVTREPEPESSRIWTPEALVCTRPQGNGSLLSEARPRTGLCASALTLSPRWG